jgi:hypothetical protein
VSLCYHYSSIKGNDFCANSGGHITLTENDGGHGHQKPLMTTTFAISTLEHTIGVGAFHHDGVINILHNE